MPLVKLVDIESEETRQAIRETLTTGSDTDEMPEWARALANHPGMLERFLQERKRKFSFPSEHYAMVQFAAAVILETKSQCKSIAETKLRAAGWDDARFVEFLMMIGEIRRNGVMMHGLGIDTIYGDNGGELGTGELTDEMRKAVNDTVPQDDYHPAGEMPAWAQVMANDPETLENFLSARRQQFSFGSEVYSMLQLAHTMLVRCRVCRTPSIRSLRTVGWDEPRFVEFAAMVGVIVRNMVLLSGLETTA